MLSYVIRRLLLMIPTLILVSLASFAIIALQEHFNGDFVSQLKLNPRVSPETIERYAKNLGLDKPWYVRYVKWLEGTLHGDFGYSFAKRQPVGALIMQYLPITLLITIPTFFLVWLLAIPIGIYSATHQYSLADHSLTLLSFTGLSVPVFFSALVVLYLLTNWGYPAVGGIFSQQYIAGSAWPWTWSWGKFVDYLAHLWPAVLVIGAVGVAGLMRIMRGTLLDIFGSQYVQTARAKGLPERVVIYKHAVRNAINPMISIFGQSLPAFVSGSLLAAQVLNLPNLEIFYFQSLQPPDEYVIITVLTFFALFLLAGNLIADILLAWVDPRVRYD
ncbi:MAG TPA: ABC transporter permease [Candidatus Fraserbacteria bacterium]|nr:ABC transporter permease [Candidatus Fraserbacteria bacterium]